jgi:hypothetical protein
LASLTPRFIYKGYLVPNVMGWLCGLRRMEVGNFVAYFRVLSQIHLEDLKGSHIKRIQKYMYARRNSTQTPPARKSHVTAWATQNLSLYHAVAYSEGTHGVRTDPSKRKMCSI